MIGDSEKFTKFKDMFEKGGVSNATPMGKENDLKADESLAWGTITNSDETGRARTHEQRDVLIPELREQQEQALLVYAQLHEQRKLAQKQSAEEAASLAFIAKLQEEEASLSLLEQFRDEDEIARYSNGNVK